MNDEDMEYSAALGLDEWTPKQSFTFNRHLCTLLVRIFELVKACARHTATVRCFDLGSSNDDSSFTVVLLNCILRPSAVGFDVKDQSVRDGLFKTCEAVRHDKSLSVKFCFETQLPPRWQPSQVLESILGGGSSACSQEQAHEYMSGLMRLNAWSVQLPQSFTDKLTLDNMKGFLSTGELLQILTLPIMF